MAVSGQNGNPGMGASSANKSRSAFRKQSVFGSQSTNFGHAAAAIYLKHHPGDYETVRRLLGHKNIQPTIQFYCGLETIAATGQFGTSSGNRSNSTMSPTRE